MSIVSNKIRRIREEGYLVDTDEKWEDLLDEDPVLSIHEYVKVVTETESFRVDGDGVTALSELAQHPLAAVEDGGEEGGEEIDPD